MIVLGLYVCIESKRPILRGVLLGDQGVVDTLTHRCDASHDIATQAREAADVLITELKGHELSVAVLLEADSSRMNSSVTEEKKKRLRVEGACIAACNSVVGRVEVLNGPQLGRRVGGNKQAALEAAAQLGLAKSMEQAAAAALAAQADGDCG